MYTKTSDSEKARPEKISLKKKRLSKNIILDFCIGERGGKNSVFNGASMGIKTDY